ncbi:MAG: carboxypeptidase-like regulatory domain-containing protein [Acidobacteria bacterium]|nr:carboxypeptidase-like regulatory domain-containing protein [Acidobacteriota bacterium]
MAVWGVPSPVVASRAFTATVGVKCAAGCRLSGMPVVVRDASGTAAGEGRLGEGPSPGSRALYAAEVSLVAPDATGVHAWIADFAGGAFSDGDEAATGRAGRETGGRPEGAVARPDATPEVAHASSSVTFSFRTAGPPDHRVTVTVRERETGSPIARAEVRIGHYRGATGADGRVVLDVAAGEHDVSVRKAGYEPHADRVAVTSDVALRVDAGRAPDPDLDDDHIWM